MLGALVLITLRQWRQHKLRVVSSALAVALGVAVFFAMRTANATLLSALGITIEKLAGKATLQITAGESGFPEETLKTVRSTPGVALSEPVVEVICRTTFDDNTRLLVLGLDTGSDQQLHEFEFDQTQTEIRNPLTFLLRPDSILVSRVFALTHKLKDGDPIRLYTPGGVKTLVVRGFFKPIGIGETFGGNLALMDVYAAQKAFDRGKNLDRIDLMNDQKTPVELLAQRLRERLPTGLDISPPAARSREIENSIATMEVGLTISSSLALFIGIFIIFNAFSISVSQRWREIGILRAVGVEAANVRRMFLGESLVIGFVGSILGVIIGFLLAAKASTIMSNVAATLYGQVATPQSPPMRWDFALLAVLVGIIASVVAAWLPARTAARLDPVLALHNVEVRQNEAELSWSRFALGAALVIVGLALTRFAAPRVGVPIQLLYSLLLQLGIIIMIPQLTRWLARVLRPLINRSFGPEGLLASDSLIKSPRRTFSTVGALMIGLSFVFSNGAFIESQKQALTRYMNRALNADMLVTHSQELRSHSFHFSESIAGQIGKTQGVARAENFRFASVPFRGDNVGLIANDMNAWFARVGNILEEGDEYKARELMPKGEGYLVARNFATRWKVNCGDLLRLETPTGPLELPVLGIFENYDSEKGTIFIERELYKQHWGDSAVDVVFLNLNSGVDPENVRRNIQAAIAGEQRAFIYTNAEYKRWVMSLIDQFFTLTYGQMVIAILVAGLGIVNTLIISVSERRREIGIIRAVGGLRSQVRKLVLVEALTVSIIGIAVGALSGVFNAYFLVHTAATMIAGFTLPLRFPTAIVLTTLPLTIVVSLLAAWFPALRAARLSVVDSIGYE